MRNIRDIKVGDTVIYSVSDGDLIFEKNVFFNTQSDADWKPYPDYHAPTIGMNIGSFLIHTEKRTVLVDTGLGKLDHHLDQTTRETLVGEIAAAGFQPQDIDTVFLTHMHMDHVGTNMTETDQGWFPTFPNARYVVSKADWALFGSRVNTRPFAYLKEQIQPLIDADVLDLIEGEINITEEITTLPTPGHTPGHTSLLISSEGEKAVIVGDAAHVPPQIEETQWSPAPDRDKDRSAASRKMMMDLIEKEHALIASGHFPSPGFGNIIRVDSRRKFIPIS